MIEPVPLAQYDRDQRRVRPRLDLIGADDLMGLTFDPIRWIVPDYLPEGFAVLAGRQKLGKSWLALNIALAVATGGMAMGVIPVEAGNVLYCDLENGRRRVQRRIDTLLPIDRPSLSRLEFTMTAPALDKGLIEALEEWRLRVPDPHLVIIDVLQRVKPAGNAARNSYENDYSAWAPLQTWATTHGVAVLGLHHVRKGGADDPLEALSGSNGLPAVADTTLVLDKDGDGSTLYARGRDVEVLDSAMTFDGGHWTLAGDAAKVRTTSERSAILDALSDATEPMTPQEIANTIGAKRNNVDRLLGKMVKDDAVKRAGRGRYLHPDHTELTEPGTNGKKVRGSAELYRNKGLSDD